MRFLGLGGGALVMNLLGLLVLPVALAQPRLPSSLSTNRSKKEIVFRDEGQTIKYQINSADREIHMRVKKKGESGEQLYTLKISRRKIKGKIPCGEDLVSKPFEISFDLNSNPAQVTIRVCDSVSRQEFSQSDRSSTQDGEDLVYKVVRQVALDALVEPLPYAIRIRAKQSLQEFFPEL